MNKLKEIISKEDAQKYLGVSKMTLHNYVQKGYLKPLGIGRKVYFLVADINEALERGYYNPLNDVA